MRSKILSSKKRQTKIFTPEKTKLFWAPPLEKNFRKTKPQFLCFVSSKSTTTTLSILFSLLFINYFSKFMPPLGIFFPLKGLFCVLVAKNCFGFNVFAHWIVQGAVP